MRYARLALVATAVLLLGSDCPNDPTVYSTPASLVGAWQYVGWYENGSQRAMSQYYACTPGSGACLPGTTTYAARADKQFAADDEWSYCEYDQGDNLVFIEEGSTTIDGDQMLLEIERRNNATLAQPETEELVWGIAADTLSLTRQIDPSTEWSFKLRK